jgi:hypothetical protein
MCTIEDSGNLLVETEDGVEDMWHRGDSENSVVEYTGNEEATLETTYGIYVMIAYSRYNDFERSLAADIHGVINRYAAGSDAVNFANVEHILTCLEKRNLIITWKDFRLLESRIQTHVDEKSICAKYFTTLLRCPDSSVSPDGPMLMEQIETMISPLPEVHRQDPTSELSA